MDQKASRMPLESSLSLSLVAYLVNQLNHLNLHLCFNTHRCHSLHSEEGVIIVGSNIMTSKTSYKTRGQQQRTGVIHK